VTASRVFKIRRRVHRLSEERDGERCPRILFDTVNLQHLLGTIEAQLLRAPPESNGTHDARMLRAGTRTVRDSRFGVARPIFNPLRGVSSHFRLRIGRQEKGRISEVFRRRRNHVVPCPFTRLPGAYFSCRVAHSATALL
jgi:hypothetical protein